MAEEMGQNILVVDDDVDIVDTIRIQLEKEGYKVFVAYDGQQAIEMLNKEAIHLMLIDVMMPRMDGFSAILKIREGKNLPIIVMSAKTEDSDKILGLSIGADDYVTKPFNSKELLARIKSQLRRYFSLGDASAGVQSVQIGRLSYDFARHELCVDGEPVKLTQTEMRILELLMRSPGRIFSAEEIYARVWDDPISFSGESTVMVHIRRIREKIEINPKEPEYLKVVWGVGYKIEKR